MLGLFSAGHFGHLLFARMLFSGQAVQHSESKRLLSALSMPGLDNNRYFFSLSFLLVSFHDRQEFHLSVHERDVFLHLVSCAFRDPCAHLSLQHLKEPVLVFKT